MTAQPGPSGETSGRLAGEAVSKYVHSAALVVAALCAVALGLLLALVFVLDYDAIFTLLVRVVGVRTDLVGGLTVPERPQWYHDAIAGLIEQASAVGADPKRMLAMAGATLVNVTAFVLSIPAVFIIARVVSRNARTGEEGEWVRTLSNLARATAMQGLMVAVSGAFMAAACTLTLVRGNHIKFVVTSGYPAIFMAALGAVLMGAAMMTRVRAVVEPVSPPQKEIPQTEPPRARMTGRELVDRLQASTIFRRQRVFDRTLLGTFEASAASQDGLPDLLQAYPLLGPIVRQAGIRELSAEQSRAVRAVLEAERSDLPAGLNFTFVGWPGSGRSTVANLLALGAALQKEGAMYCVTSGPPSGDFARHPGPRIRGLLAACGLDQTVNILEAYGSHGLDEEALRARPDLVFSDAAMLCDFILADMTPQRWALVSRLRYVIIDSPDRLPRDEFLRLSVALGRLRLLGELAGHVPTFMLILPRIQNHDTLGKSLCRGGHLQDALYFQRFVPPCHFVGWSPPLEVINPNDGEAPVFARANFDDEVRALLAEIGTYSIDLERELKIAIIDAEPLLGPELRANLTERIRESLELLARERGETSVVVQINWEFFASADLGVDQESVYDVIVVVGIGAHPVARVAALRGALRSEGALIMVAEPSPADLTSLLEIRDPEWRPEVAIQDADYESILLPEQSEPLAEFEIAALFEQVGHHPLSINRIESVFPDVVWRRLLESWLATCELELVERFDRTTDRATPTRARCARTSAHATLRSADFAVHWGCSTRDVLEAWDLDENAPVTDRPRLTRFVDRDRAFIDLHVQSIHRLSPDSIRVSSVALNDRPDANGISGRVSVRSRWVGDDLKIDRRRARYRQVVLDSRLPSGIWQGTHQSHTGGDIPAGEALIVPIPNESDIPGTLAQELARELVSVDVTAAGAPTGAGGRVVTGSWLCAVTETLRDVVSTDRRLVQEPWPGLVRKVEVGTLERTFTAPAFSLYLQPGAEHRCDAADTYAAHHGLARAIEARLERVLLNYHDELRVAVQPLSADARSHGFSSYRLVFYRMRSSQEGRGGFFEWLAEEPENLRNLLRWCRERLEACDCEDGCSQCCGGLGTIPLPWLPRPDFTDADAVSRRGAYDLVNSLLGLPANEERYRAEREDRTDISASDSDLQALVRRIIGTGPDYEDGVWAEVFGAYMPFALVDGVAPASWFPKNDPNAPAGCAGYYSSGPNEVGIRDGEKPPFLEEIIVHEYAHNWQFRGHIHTDSGKVRGFDHARHGYESAATPFFEGKLVIEGHATWSQTQYRMLRRRGPAYRASDSHAWDQYKVGYLLFEHMERTLGTRGLFAWLAGTRPDPSLPNALRDARLLEAARGGRYTDYDVVDS